MELIYRNGNKEDLSQSQHTNTMLYEIQHFIDLLKNQQYESSINTFEKSLVVTEIMDEARKQIGVIYPAD